MLSSLLSVILTNALSLVNMAQIKLIKDYIINYRLFTIAYVDNTYRYGQFITVFRSHILLICPMWFFIRCFNFCRATVVSLEDFESRLNQVSVSFAYIFILDLKQTHDGAVLVCSILFQLSRTSSITESVILSSIYSRCRLAFEGLADILMTLVQVVKLLRSLLETKNISCTHLNYQYSLLKQGGRYYRIV